MSHVVTRCPCGAGLTMRPIPPNGVMWRALCEAGHLVEANMLTGPWTIVEDAT